MTRRHATSDALFQLHRALLEDDHEWPTPRPDHPLVRPEQRVLARQQWTRRAAATRQSVEQIIGWLAAISLSDAPAAALSPAIFCLDELNRHLYLTLHICESLGASPAEAQDHSTAVSPTPEAIFDTGVELFAFNLTLSRATYLGLSAVSSDKAIISLCETIERSLTEVIAASRTLLDWMIASHQPKVARQARARTPSLLFAYERLFDAGPQTLDRLAGQEISVDTEAGNLGTLQPSQLAAIYYHTVDQEIFPWLDHLGLRSDEAWRVHYEVSPSPEAPPACAAAVGIDITSQPH
ncbi:hypothetical protein FRC98_00370 [Lujinxingia vulgaris]|uniref:Uncharacterized protein n=1 Tax=Lujinxingia vulgaris TaxID=2600176 RepID=A0A5C6XMR9_9DELT|nr:hypothetical protein [Lujinxingia vulgaris]TXD38892.1 hypothetical protein FRC98_00370 [Lujinxingia vulgaris]